jgi:hypothetical protein
VVAGALGRDADRDRHYAAALELCARLGLRSTATLLRVEWAEQLLAQGPADGRARACALLDAAAEEAVGELAALQPRIAAARSR